MSGNPIPFATVEEASKKSARARQIFWSTMKTRERGRPHHGCGEDHARSRQLHGQVRPGLVCLALTEERCDELALPLMTPVNTSNYGTAFCESIDARRGTTTESALPTARPPSSPRSMTPRALRPGASRPYLPAARAHGGVLVRAGQTEASVDLARMAGLTPAGVICEIMNEDGTMARVPQLAEFCRRHGLKLLTVAEVIRYRMRNERYVGASPRRSADALRRVSA